MRPSRSPRSRKHSSPRRRAASPRNRSTPTGRPFARFREWVGDLPVYGVTTLDVTKFYKRLTETASDKNDGKLDRGTVYRSCSNLRQFYRWAVSQHLIEEDPTRKLIVEAGGDDDGWEPYSDTDLAAIFAPTPFLPLSAHQRWFPLVGLHSGMRLSEIAQLETSDIITLNGRPHFSVSRVSKFGNDKTFNTDTALLPTPSNPTLISLSFLSSHTAR